MKNSFEHHYHTFDSGLRLITIPMPATRTATVLVLVGTGSKYETKQINSISHLLPRNIRDIMPKPVLRN